jgi:hypothetical protein
MFKIVQKPVVYDSFAIITARGNVPVLRYEVLRPSHLFMIFRFVISSY